MTAEEIRKAWLSGTTCALKPNDVREVMFANDTHIVLKHRSHAEYIDRMSGSRACTAFAKLYCKDELVANLGRTGGYFVPALKEWSGRINPRVVQEECSTMGINFLDVGWQIKFLKISIIIRVTVTNSTPKAPWPWPPTPIAAPK